MSRIRSQAGSKAQAQILALFVLVHWFKALVPTYYAASSLVKSASSFLSRESFSATILRVHEHNFWPFLRPSSTGVMAVPLLPPLLTSIFDFALENPVPEKTSVEEEY